ncbi:HIT domain-containing protein [Candidatus Woesearchaeota archaeon]|nr:HIT domain-containing protein [Candidatus Woesearchaeota archaeon]
MAEAQPTEEELKNMSPEEMAEFQKKNCVFCRIIAGEVPSHKVYEDDKIIAILDIYPSTKGHTLVLPKEHVPIMPLISPETFKHLFSKIKYLAKGVKNGTPAPKSSIFIANGAAAGQQSPHFLLHIIPRDDDDMLENFNIPSKDISQDDLLKPLKANLEKMMHSHLQKDGKILLKPPSKDDLAMIIEQNPQLKELLIKDPTQVKQAMELNPQMKALFQGVDVEKLSKKLKEGLGEEKKPEPTSEELSETKVSDALSSEATGAPKDKLLSDAQKPEEVSDTPKPEKEEEKAKPEDEKKSKSLLDKVTHMFSK